MVICLLLWLWPRSLPPEVPDDSTSTCPAVTLAQVRSVSESIQQILRVVPASPNLTGHECATDSPKVFNCEQTGDPLAIYFVVKDEPKAEICFKLRCVISLRTLCRSRYVSGQ